MKPTTCRPTFHQLTLSLAPALALTLAVAGALAPSALADDAKKAALAQAKLEAQLKQCADTYADALTACSKLQNAVTCYNQADQADLGCRQALGAVGHSTVPPAQFPLTDPILRKPTFPAPVPVPQAKKPLDCSGGPITAVVCAEGHARKPDPCIATSPGVNGGVDRNPVPPTIDAAGTTDTCSGRPINCPAGFTQLPRRGEDLCWDSAALAAFYQY